MCEWLTIFNECFDTFARSRLRKTVVNFHKTKVFSIVAKKKSLLLRYFKKLIVPLQQSRCA